MAIRIHVRLTARLRNQNELIKMIDVSGEKLAGSMRVVEGRKSRGSFMSASSSEVFAR